MKHNIFDHNSRIIKSKNNVFGDFLVEKGLYDEIEITRENIYELADLIGGHVKIDVYCPKCKENRVFSSEAIKMNRGEGKSVELSLEKQILSYQRELGESLQHLVEGASSSWHWSNMIIADDIRVMVFRFVCAMDDSHRIDYIVLTEGNQMIKIGQYPSVADLSFPEFKNYQKVMSENDMKELKKAIGLYADGIGVGSFVYLRRLFERILDKTSKKAIDEGAVLAAEYKKARMEEKTKMLSAYLPKCMNGNQTFYGIVSKGIHELSEEECIEYFPVLKGYIMMIYRQWKKMREDEEEEKKLLVSLSKISTKISQ